MGILDSILAPVLGIAAPLDPTGIVGTVGAAVTGVQPTALGGPPSAIPAALAPVTAVTDLVSGVLNIPGQIVGAVAGGGAGPVDLTGFGGGNGSRATRTVVETVDVRTGQIVSRKIMPGSPYLMNSEIKAAKKVWKQAANLQKRIPRKVRKQSQTEQLKDAAIQAAITETQSPSRDVVSVRT